MNGQNTLPASYRKMMREPLLSSSIKGEMDTMPVDDNDLMGLAAVRVVELWDFYLYTRWDVTRLVDLRYRENKWI